MKIILPAGIYAETADFELDDGRTVSVSGHGHVSVHDENTEYQFTLPEIGTVAEACTAKYGRGTEGDGNGKVTVPLDMIHRH